MELVTWYHQPIYEEWSKWLQNFRPSPF